MRQRNTSRVVRILHEYEQQLSLDLQNEAVNDQDSTGKVIPFPVGRTSPSVSAKEAPAQSITWTEEEIDTLRERLLTHSLHGLLDNRASQALKEDVMQWVNSDELGPFSFNVCAIQNGYRPELLRIQINNLLVRAQRQIEEGSR